MCIALSLAVCACDFSDPLSAVDNGEGLLLLDSLSGWNESRRTICVVRERSSTSCSSASAEVHLSGVAHPGQVAAQWRRGDPRTVDVFLFGGSIERCRPRSRDGGVTIVLRQLPLERMPSRDSWNPDASAPLFEGQPDRCRA
jgi:hypothetical protein